MFAKGYVTARMIAQKMARHTTTIHRLIEAEEIAFTVVGSTKFVEITEFVSHIDEDVQELFSLDDWTQFAA